MTPLAQAVPAPVVPAYRLFNVAVLRTERLSTNFVRVTLGGAQLRHFAPSGLDQRIKIAFPDRYGEYAPFWEVGEVSPTTTQWRSQWRALPEARRNPLRSYTVRNVRPKQREIDVDFVLHDPSGPASRWAAQAALGEELVVCGPDVRAEDRLQGIQWHPGAATKVLLVGDETAIPAIHNIVRTLGDNVTGQVLLEAETDDDLHTPALSDAAIDVTTRVREGAATGSCSEAMVREWMLSHGHQAVQFGDDFYAWIAGETSDVSALRRCFVRELGIAAHRVHAQGYWRRGKRRRP